MNEQYAETLFEELSSVISHVSESSWKCKHHCINKYNTTVNSVIGDILIALDVDHNEETGSIVYNAIAQGMEFEKLIDKLEIDIEEE